MNRVEDGRTKGTRYMLAGLSNMVAQTCTNPIDVIKIRMQCQTESGPKRAYNGMLHGMYTISRSEGVWVLVSGGLVAALLREASFSTIRMGGYEEIKNIVSRDSEHKHTVPLYKKVFSGMCSGGIAAACTTPTDVAKVRLQSDQASKYPHTLKLLRDVAVKEGVAGLWRGTGPNVIRATIGTSTQISSYDHCKTHLLHHGLLEEGPLLHFTASTVAGFCTATAYNPVDVAKSRIQAQQIVPGQRPKYRSTVQVLRLIAAQEGLVGWYKGWLPCWIRIAPHTCITFLVFEQLRVLAKMQPI